MREDCHVVYILNYLYIFYLLIYIVYTYVISQFMLFGNYSVFLHKYSNLIKSPNNTKKLVIIVSRRFDFAKGPFLTILENRRHLCCLGENVKEMTKIADIYN